MPVLYLAGTGRSGSTIVANVLGEVDGWVSVGELRYVWERGLVEDRLCGCGSAFGECPFWGRVLKTAFGDDLPDVRAVLAAQQRVGRLRNLPRVLASRRDPQRLLEGTGSLGEDLRRLYAAVLEVSGAGVVVDSSKLPTYAVLLDCIAGLDVTVLHLVRDPRAAAHSWRRRKVQPDRRTHGYMERRGAAKSVGLWVLWNGALELLWSRRPDRYVRVAYEDVVTDPTSALAPALRALGAPADALDGIVEGATVHLHPNHTVAGNPARLTSGAVPLTLDDEWLRAMPARDRALVSVAAAGLSRRYGYPVLPRSRRPAAR